MNYLKLSIENDNTNIDDESILYYKIIIFYFYISFLYYISYFYTLFHIIFYIFVAILSKRKVLIPNLFLTLQTEQGTLLTDISLTSSTEISDSYNVSIENDCQLKTILRQANSSP